MSYETEFSASASRQAYAKRKSPWAAAFLAVAVAAVVAVVLRSSPSGAVLPVALLTTSTVADYQNVPLTGDGSVPPLVMLLLSRDEQLSVKAYTDYTDLNDDDVLDTTYTDSFDYGGYFDPKLCYSQTDPSSTVAGVFKAVRVATGTNKHECEGDKSDWSGNFLNWLTMTRLDIVSFVLFGGKRFTDLSASVSGAAHTILQRSYLPNDVHSFSKVYPALGAKTNDIEKFTPYTDRTSFCNTSDKKSADAYFPTGSYRPLLRVAAGNFPQWAATESNQCVWGDGTGDQPSSSASGSTELNVFVDVCNNSSATLRESFCREYSSTTAAVTTTVYKPAGLIQQYGEAGQLRFGLMTGTYDKPRTGGLLRRNISLIAKNNSSTTDADGCATGDEVGFKTGKFCNTGSGTEGIVNTIKRFQIAEWKGSPSSGGGYENCSSGTTNRGNNGLFKSPNTQPNNTGRKCTDWNNPLAEIYAEALRYIQGGSKSAASTHSAATPNYQPASASIDKSLGLPNDVTWAAPYTSSNYCASCSIIVLSTGFGSFDTDEVGTVASLLGAKAATTNLGTVEDTLAQVASNPGFADRVIGNDVIGFAGETNLESTTLAEPSTGTSRAICAARAITDFGNVRGICPEQPTREGGYYLSGLAYEAWTKDLMPSLTGTQRVETYAVALAETLPSLTLPTSGGKIVISPLCQSYGGNNLNKVDRSDDPKGTPCSLIDVAARPVVGNSNAPSPFANVTYGLPASADGKRGSLQLLWEDQPWGNDFDRDISVMLSYCVGDACKYDGDTTGDGVGRYDICEDKVYGPASSLTDTNVTIPARGAICANTTQLNTPTFFGPNTHLDIGGTPNRITATTPSSNTTYKPTVAADEALVRIEMISATHCDSLLAGFNVSGSNLDGVYRPLLRPGRVPNPSNACETYSVITGSGIKAVGTTAQVFRLKASGSDNNLLKNPLFYAAKYGGFTYNTTDTAKQPAARKQWDSLDNATGAEGSDGLPDNYFPVRNPSQLKTQLGRVLSSILSKSGSGTAAAVVASDRQGQGVVYQALYEPAHLDADDSNKKATWIGTLQAFFVDSQGRLREDGNQDAKLNDTSLAEDPVITIGFDTSTRTTTVTRDTGSGAVADTTASLKPIFNARKQLAALKGNAQRAKYTDKIDNDRYIFTFLDYNRDGVADKDEQVPFTDASFPTGSSAWGMFNTTTRANALGILDYVRGTDGPIDGKTTRNRTIKYSAGESSQPQRLGDIINSSPTAVTAPAESFDLLYSDPSYGDFFKKYRLRRSVVYVGANDGMLHAFNSGFYNPTTRTFALKSDGGSETEHPLGAELWAYVPFNLLPHLTWLTDPDYPHVSYVDGKPRVFDARIFADDTTHPGGWGTVLVVGFRFGGGNLTMTALDSEAFGKFGVKTTNATGGETTRSMTTGDTLTTRSSYVILDITDPEQAPTLLAEINNPPGTIGTDPQLGFTTSYPTVATFKGSGDEGWYLVFGNGPTKMDTTTSHNAGVYLYDLKTKAFVEDFKPKALPGATTSFTGDPVSVDWELDYNSNSIYVGTIGNPTLTSSVVTAQSGQLYKLNFNNINTKSGWTLQSLLDPGNPVTATPSVTQDEFGRRFVFAGTGRFYFKGDKASKKIQSLFGIIDQTDEDDLTSTATVKPKKAAPDYGSLVDTSTAVVKTDGTVSNVKVGSTDVTSQTDLIAKVIAKGGWKLNLAGNNASDSTTIAERNLNSSAVLGDTVFMTAFTPSTDQCVGDGSSRLFGLYYKTGAGRADAPVFGLKPSSTEVLRSYDLSGGLAAAPGLRANSSTAAQAISVLTQTSTGAIQRNSADVKNNIRSQEVDWRENHP